MRAVLAGLLLGLFVAEVHAQTPPAHRPAAAAPVLSETAKAALGTWEFSNSDRDKICSLTLKPESAGNAFRIEFDERCAAAFPLIGGVVGWRMADNELLRFVDASGKPLIEFSEVESGMYEAPTPGYGVLFLQSGASANPPAKSTEELAGDWTLERANKPVCELALSTNEAGEGGFALRVKPGCDAAVARFNAIAWRLDRGELVLANKNGDTWRFEESDNSVWRRIPVRNDGYALVKK